MKAMILAAGKGERLRPFTFKTPKPLMSVNGKPLIEYNIEKLALAGIKEIIINHAWLGEKIEDSLGNGEKWDVKITYSKEEQALGTGGGIKNVLSFFGKDPFIVISGDIVSDYPLSKLVNYKLDDKTFGHIILIDNPLHHPQGDYYLIDNKIRLLSLKSEKLEKRTFASIGLLTAKLFMSEHKNPSSIALYFNDAIKSSSLTGENYKGYHCNVDTFERLQNVEKDKKTNLINSNRI